LCYYIKGFGEKDEAVISKERLHSLHILALEKCSLEFERLTSLDMDLNTEYDSLLNDIRGLYSNYILVNQAKEKNQPKRSMSAYFSEMCLGGAVSSGLEMATRSKSFGSFAELKSNLTKPVDLVQSTIFVSSLVFFLFSSYIMLFHDFISNLNVQYSTVIGYFFILVRYIASHCFDIFKDFLQFCFINLKNARYVKNSVESSEIK
jgi:hypothetical protein